MNNVNCPKQKEFAPLRSRLSKGFTLIELLVVIAILAILATVTLVSLNPTQKLKDARHANRLQATEGVGRAFTNYVYNSGNLCTDTACGTTNTPIVDKGGSVPVDGKVYVLGGAVIPAAITGTKYIGGTNASDTTANCVLVVGSTNDVIDLAGVTGFSSYLPINPIDPLGSAGTLNHALSSGKYVPGSTGYTLKFTVDSAQKKITSVTITACGDQEDGNTTPAATSVSFQ